MQQSDRQDRLTIVKRFLEKRGGLKGLSKAGLKGILCSLPLAGKTIEEVVFNAADQSIAQQVESAVGRCTHEIQQADDGYVVADRFLELADAMLILAHVAETDRARLITATVHKLAEIEMVLSRIEIAQAGTRKDVEEVLTILKEGARAKKEHEDLACKVVAVFALNRLLVRVRSLWPPQPFLGRTPDASSCVRRTILGLQDILRQAHTVAEFLWDRSDLYTMREHLERNVEIALRRYEATQGALEDWGFANVVERLKETPANESVYNVIPLWLGCLESIAEVAQNRIIESLKEESLIPANESLHLTFFR